MTQPTQAFRRQGQGHKTRGTGTQGMEQGAYTSELFATGNLIAGTDTAFIAGVTGYKIRILSYSISGAAGGVSTASFTSKPAGAGTAIGPLISLPANGFAAEADNNGLFQSINAGEGISATVATNTVGVRATYILVT